MKLPPGWARTTLGEIAETRLGKMLDAAKNLGSERPYLRNVNVRWGGFDLSDLQAMRVTEEEFDALRVRDGDIFACEGGEPGRCAVWREGPREVVYQKALHRIRPEDGIDPDFVAKRIEAAVRHGEVARLLTGTTIKHLPQIGLQRIELEIPPALEQRRIVARLDALTTRFARARAETGRAIELAEAAARSVLSLTLDSVSNFPKVRLKDVTSKIGSGSTPRGGREVYVSDGVPFVRSQNVHFEGFNSTGLARIKADAARALAAVAIQEGDVLLNITGASIGRACIAPREILGARVSQHVAIIRPTDVLRSGYLLAWLRSPVVQDWISNANYGVTRQALTKSMIEGIEVPLPSVALQDGALRSIDAAFARADRLEAEARKALALIDRLEAAIVTRAFHGGLVPQDPNDEPATVLLERIRARRAAEPKAKRGRRPKLTS